MQATKLVCDGDRKKFPETGKTGFPTAETRFRLPLKYFAYPISYFDIYEVGDVLPSNHSVSGKRIFSV
jgi:hypothetical protein